MSDGETDGTHLGEARERAAALRQKAMEAYQEALAASPQNLLVNMRVAGLLERDEDYVGAMDRYAEMISAWPAIFEPRYRLAATLGMAEAWAPLGTTRGVPTDLQALRPAPRGFARVRGWPDGADLVEGSLSQLRQDLLAPTAGVVRRSLEEAAKHWNQVERHLMLHRCVARVLLPRRGRDNDRRFHLSVLRSWDGRARNRRAVQLASICTEVQLKVAAPEPLAGPSLEPDGGAHEQGASDRNAEDGSPEEVREQRVVVPPLGAVRRRLQRLLADEHLLSWSGRYNGACAYARLYEVGGEAADLLESLSWLERAQTAEGGQRTFVVAEHDPDLASVASLRPLLEWCRDRSGASSWSCIYMWAARTADDLSTWWTRWEGVVERDEELRRRALEADARIWIAMTSILRDQPSDDDEFVLVATAAVEGALALHVRVGMPPSPSGESDHLVRREVAGLVEDHDAFDRPPDASISGRGERWSLLAAGVRNPPDRGRAASGAAQP